MKEIVHHLKCFRKNNDETKDETWVGATVAEAVLLTEDRGQGSGMKPPPGQEAGGWGWGGRGSPPAALNSPLEEI